MCPLTEEAYIAFILIPSRAKILFFLRKKWKVAGSFADSKAQARCDPLEESFKSRKVRPNSEARGDSPSDSNLDGSNYPRQI